MISAYLPHFIWNGSFSRKFRRNTATLTTFLKFCEECSCARSIRRSGSNLAREGEPTISAYLPAFVRHGLLRRPRQTEIPRKYRDFDDKILKSSGFCPTSLRRSGPNLARERSRYDSGHGELETECTTSSSQTRNKSRSRRKEKMPVCRLVCAER